jgi:hypothetical protein
MLKFRSRILAVATATAAAGGLAFAGVPAASASPAARGAVSGIEHFQLMTTSETSNKESIIAIGRVFTAGGVDHEGSKVDKVVFPRGTFKIRHSRGKGRQRFNARTCLGVINLHGSYKLFHGTGRYAGISGRGTYRLSIIFVAARNASRKCTLRKAPHAYQQVIVAHGPMKL